MDGSRHKVQPQFSIASPRSGWIGSKRAPRRSEGFLLRLNLLRLGFFALLNLANKHPTMARANLLTVSARPRAVSFAMDRSFDRQNCKPCARSETPREVTANNSYSSGGEVGQWVFAQYFGGDHTVLRHFPFTSARQPLFWQRHFVCSAGCGRCAVFLSGVAIREFASHYAACSVGSADQAVRR